MARTDDLTDEQWAILSPLIADATPPAWRNRSKKYTDRAILNAALWVLRNGSGWSTLPKRFPPAGLCFRRVSRWIKTGILRLVLEAIARDLEQGAQIDLSACFSDGTFVVARKGKEGPLWERPDAAAIRSSTLLQTLMVFHSPCTRLLLAYLRTPLSQLPSLQPSFWDTADVLAGIMPASAIRAMRNPHETALP